MQLKRILQQVVYELKTEFSVDDEGSIVDRIAEMLPEGTTIFDIKISIELPDEESESAE